MRIAFNPSTVAALTSPPNNKDITFDLRGQNIFARGVKFYGTDTNTWRDIKINNVSIGSHTLDLRNGSNTTLTNTNGVVTINSTWRPVVDNLTSNSATSSLSANQGRVLAGLINGKSDSDHNHDGRYLRLNGSDTMQGKLYLHSYGTSYIGIGSGDKSGADFTEANIVISSWWGISFKSNDNIVRTYIDTRTGNIGTKGVLNAVGAIIQGRVYNNGDDEGIIIKPSSNGYAGLILGAHDGERSVFYYKSGNAFWRYGNGSSIMDIYHPKKSGTIALTSDIPSSVKNPYSLTTFGVVYDGSAEKVVSPSNFISQLGEDTNVVTDGTMFVTSYASDKGFADTNAVNVPYKRKAARLWDYIKAKTDSLYATKNHNHDDRYLKLTGGVLKGQIILPDIDVNTSYTGSIIIGASNTENLGIDGNEIMARNNGKASTLYLNNEGGAVQLGAILRTNSNIAYMGSQSTQNMIKFINNTIDSSGNGIAIGGGGLTIIGSGESSDVVMGQHSSGGEENMIIAGDVNIDFYSNLQDGWKYGKHMYLDTNGYLFTPSYINIGGNENNNSSPDRVWGSNSSDSYLRSYRTSALNVANADTVDGEHASNFVRAGNFGSANLNSLDTYSFIKSGYSTVASASPGGYTGWYNVIQAVHKNGSEDGPGYIGQIALGMTTNINKMFYRTKYNGSWYAWNEVVTTNTGLLRYSRNNVNISSSNCSPIPPSLLEWTVGYPRLYDPEFNDGYNNVQVYNNASNGVVTVTRERDTNVGNSGNYVIKVISAEGAYPDYGGWHVQTQTELGKVYTCLFRAIIPSGVEIECHSNSIGTGGQMSWLTNHMSTGKWTWYAVQVYCGSGGSTTFFFSAKSPCTWYLSYVNVIENNRASYAGLRSVYSDYLKANASIVFGRDELQYFNQCTGVTAGATNNANPETNWYHILRMNHSNNSGYFVDLAIPFFDNRIQFRRITNGSDNGWRRVITEEHNHNVLLCDGSDGGSVGIGISPSYKLDVNGQVRASGFHHSSVNSDNYMLLAGGGYKSFGGDDSNPIFLGYLNLDHGNDGTIRSYFSCLGYSVPFTYTRGGNYCRIYIPDTTHQVFYIRTATASVHYSGGGMDTWTGNHRGSGAWWLHCYAYSTNEIRVKGFCQKNANNDSWWGGNPLWSGNDGANRITVCIFGYVKLR